MTEVGKLQIEKKLKMKEITITGTRKKLKRRKNCKAVRISMKSVRLLAYKKL